MTKAPKFDLNKKPIYDINQIQKILPHRPPFLFVDKIIEMSETRVVGVKNVTMNEGYFVGHFPNEPIMPGVLQAEAMAQTGGILVLSTVPDPENYITHSTPGNPTPSPPLILIQSSNGRLSKALQ